MTTTTFTPQASLGTELQRMLDEASDLFRQPPSMSYARTEIGGSAYFHVFVATLTGHIVCIDQHLRVRLPQSRIRYTSGRGFTLPRNRAAHEYIFEALASFYGADYARKVQIREVA